MSRMVGDLQQTHILERNGSIQNDCPCRTPPGELGRAAMLGSPEDSEEGSPAVSREPGTYAPGRMGEEPISGIKGQQEGLGFLEPATPGEECAEEETWSSVAESLKPIICAAVELTWGQEDQPGRGLWPASLSKGAKAREEGL